MKKMISTALILALVFSLCACGGTQTEQNAQDKVYPIKSESELMEEAVEIDPIIFSTTGEENGLPGSIFHFEGKVKSSEEFNGTSYLVITTDNGDLVLFSPADVLGDAEYFKPLLSEEDYTMPQVGETAEFYAMYGGFSGKLEMPTFYLGANEFLADQYRNNASETLEITLEEMVDLISPAKEIKTFTTYDTEEFTISKAGTTSDGVVCFSLPEKNELSVVYFLSYAEASSAYHRTEAKEAQKILEQYCSDNGISILSGNKQIDNTMVYYVEAEDCELAGNELPITLKEFRADNEFFSDVDRINKYYGLLMTCGYEELYLLLEEYLAGDDITDVDNLKELKTCISELIELMPSCVITEDSIEGNAKIQCKDALDISAKQCVIPILETSKYTGAMIEYKLGFQKNDWLFFDTITAVAGESKNSCTYKSYEVNSDVLSGGKISEYIYTSGFNLVFAEANEQNAGIIRFENTSTKEVIDHEITEDELNAIETLEQIKALHDKLFYAAKSWEQG